ncbi:helix-turn-helix domain-containing protein [Mesorhizobium tianshanense]|uniref:Homeodomain-like domain-containing protein n=1 Tax=Mesorhizobium tianshanense TaxID=39844 RepID=A0A562NT34_9HYPH|nr:helix-turn-helix domain-containing protein [Mesorhizobium tianshanense]TWI35293.1 Homeodomain-like domain-containing protein [Mesorhizobium tianshanense]
MAPYALPHRKGFLPANPGRPFVYDAEKAIRLAETGIPREEIARQMRVTFRTVQRWQVEHPEFAAALDRGLHNAKAKAAHAAEAAAELKKLLDIAALLDGPAEPARRVEAFPGTQEPADRANEPDGLTRPSIASMRRGQPPQEPEEPQGWQDETDVEPVPFDDPRSEW